ncbi:MAG: phosphatase PAP2 family protein, partial [Brevibacterium sp.]|nr:phosphatase PAP2 family protein [Brevibacterium sp.]
AHVIRLAEAGAVPPLATPPEDEDGAAPAEITPPLEPVRLRFHWSMILAFAWILLMMWSRTALQVHWLTDTIAGALIGISAAVLADELWTWVTMRTRSPHLQR